MLLGLWFIAHSSGAVNGVAKTKRRASIAVNILCRTKAGAFLPWNSRKFRVQEIGGLFDNALVYLQSISNGKLESLRLPRIEVLESPRSKVHERPVYQMLWPPISGPYSSEGRLPLHIPCPWLYFYQT